MIVMAKSHISQRNNSKKNPNLDIIPPLVGDMPNNPPEEFTRKSPRREKKSTHHKTLQIRPSCRKLSSLITKSQYSEENPVLLRKAIPQNPLKNSVFLQGTIFQSSPEKSNLPEHCIITIHQKQYHSSGHANQKYK